MEERWLVGGDIGGTTLKLAFVTLVGELVTKWEIPTDKSENGHRYSLVSEGECHSKYGCNSKCRSNSELV